MGRKRSASEIDGASQRGDRRHAPPTGTGSQKPSRTTQLKLQSRSDWYAHELSGLPEGSALPETSYDLAEKLHQHAVELLHSENKAYATIQEGRSSNKFASTIMSAGTLEDKVSALTLLVQESPLHNVKAFENLLGLAKKKSREQALMAAVAVKDLLGQGGVLPDRKLRTFVKQPQLMAALSKGRPGWSPGRPLPGDLDEQHLILWAFEDWLKAQYFDFLKVLESWCSDEVAYARSRAITYTWELLKDKPEQEENLLRLLVSKLGDKDRKIASRVSYLLLQLQISHPAMKAIIINSIENDCLFRPGQSIHAKYFSIVTLNQTVLGKADAEVVSQLLRIYFSMFVQLLKPSEATLKEGQIMAKKHQDGGGKPGKRAAQKVKEKAKDAEAAEAAEVEIRDKMTAQVLTGINRAFPYADTESESFAEQIDLIFRVAHSSNFNTSLQALMLLQKLTSRKHHGVDRYYRSLYESLLDPRLISSSKQIMYLNLLYKSLKSDVSIKRVQAFVKRMLQILNMHDVPFICGILYLISELRNTFQSIRSMMQDAELSPEDEEEHFVDAPDADEDALSQPKRPGVAPQVSAYDPRKREPEHSNADKSSLWDILPLVSHFHPSVALFAECLLDSREMPPKPDPASHTVMHFLDRFVYRNARTKQDTTRGSSIMQPLSNSAAADLLIKSGGTGAGYGPVNVEGFWTKNVEDVPVDQVFFHSYFTQANKGKITHKKKAAKKGGDDESGGEDEGEDEIWKALVDSRPEVEGMDDDDDDISMGDLESAFSDSDGGMDLDGEGDMDAGVEIADFPSDDEDMMAEMDGLDAGGSDEDAFDMDDEDALLGDDAEVPFDIEDEGAESGDESKPVSKSKQKREQRRKLKQLPTFASAEDYAKLLADEPDDY